MNHDHTPHRLNIFALPNQVAILVILLACVLYGALIAIGADVQPLVFWTLTGGLLGLSLRRLLSWPEREYARNKLAPAGEEFAPVQALIARLARELRLPRTPQLMLSPGNSALRIFGSWRRWYITMGEDSARAVLESLDDSTETPRIEAAILHELCHFKHGDNIWTGYAHALLHTSLWLMGWATAMLVGILGFTILARESLFVLHSPAQVAQRFDAIMPGTGQLLATLSFGSDEQWQRLRAQAAGTDLGQALLNNFVNTFPLILIGGGLLLVFWQQLMRTREIYADAGVAHIQGQIGPLLGSLVTMSETISNKGPLNTPRPLIRTIIEQARDLWRRAANKLVRYHFKPGERRLYLREPQHIYGNWRRQALLIGFFTLVLDLILTGTSALFYVGNWPLHFPILAAFILIALTLLTPIAIGQPVWLDSLRIIGVVTIIRFVLLLVDLTLLIVGLIVFPDLLARFIDILTRAVAGFTGLSPAILPDDLDALMWRAVRINLLQIPVMFLTILLASWSSVALARRLLTWYGFPGITIGLSSKLRMTLTLMRVIYLALVLLTLLLAFGALPLVTDMVVERASVELVLVRLTVAAVTLLIVLPTAVWLWRLDHRYARRCPGCGKTIPGYYWLGRRCDSDTCGQVLNSWLLANYDTEVAQ